ncbi:MAG TPA: hypothetical protein VH309_02370, partial [Elusimicrobiota bacterium]|nr:hypothetical protein [Elusimicrobiota bacterium]
SGLTAGTVYHYAAKSHDSSGDLTTSPDATFTTVAAAPVIPPGCVVSEGGAWQNVSMSRETGSFTATFSATPAKADMDGVIGLSDGASAALTSQAAAVRFNNTGTIDARNGGAYAAAASIPYVAGTAYSFELVVNLKKRTYSAYVTGPSGQKTIALNYAFRTEQKAATLLNNVAAFADAGSVMVCNVVP